MARRRTASTKRRRSANRTRRPGHLRPTKRRQPRRATSADRPDAYLGPDQVRCLECGKAFITVNTNHLVARHGYAGQGAVHAYQEKFGLEFACADSLRRTLSASVSAHYQRVYPAEVWPGHRVVKELRRRHAAGGDLRARAVPQAIRAAARRHFGTWATALERAAVQRAGRTRPPPPAEARISAGVRRLAGRGEPLYARNVARCDRPLLDAAVARYGSWKPALRRAGFNPVHHADPMDVPTLADAKAWARRRHRAGESVLARDVPSDLYACVMNRVHGGWAAFVDSLGITYPGVVKRRDWMDATVLRAIRARKRAGKGLTSSAVKDEHQALWHQGRNRFGSWDAALEAVGIDPRAIRQSKRWRADEVVAAVAARARGGEPLDASTVVRQAKRIYRWGLHHFGTWDDVLRAVGRDPAEHRRPGNRLTVERIAEHLRARVRRGEPVRARCIAHRWKTFVREATGLAWPDFVEHLGLPYGRRLVRWSRDEVLRRLQQRERAGATLHARAVCREFSSIYIYAGRFFGSWDAALEAAGIDRAVGRARRRWSRPEVVAAIRRRQRRGRPLDSTSVRGTDRALWNAATNLFDSAWSRALAAAGVDPAKHDRRRARFTRREAETFVRRRLRRHGVVARDDLPPKMYHFLRHRLGMGLRAFVESLGLAYVDPRSNAARQRGARPARRRSR